MYICVSCDHPLFFHRPGGPKQPCFLCPPKECLVKKCACAKYEGNKLTNRPHEDHNSLRVPWGTWGLIAFELNENQTFISAPQSVIERAVVRPR